MRIKYKLTNGEATDICYVENSYQLQSDEYYAPFYEITKDNVESLHTQEYKDSRNQEKLKQQAILLLSETDHKVLSDYPYPDDIPSWVSYRTALRDVIKGVSSVLPTKPF